MIRFGPMSITLGLAALQGLVLATLLLRARANRDANRWLALLILGFVLLITPFIIGYAGFYDRWPWLSFAPFSWTLAFGPLLWCHVMALTGAPPARPWLHLLPAAVQGLADALVFPLPLATKDRWNELVNEPLLAPAFDLATLVSILVYGLAAWQRYRAYRHWLAEVRADGVDFDPSWIRNALAALLLVTLIWSGFLIANRIDPTRDYFDQFWLYVLFSALVLYLGIEGWRHAELRFPAPLADAERSAAAEAAADADAGLGVQAGQRLEVAARDWAAMGRGFLACIDAEGLWRDPDITLAGLARRLGTNTAYLSRALNAAAGENFNAIINRRRVAAVQARLAAPGETRDLLTLALDTGFSSKASFNRAFAEFAGMSPSAWRLKSQKDRVKSLI